MLSVEINDLAILKIIKHSKQLMGSLKGALLGIATKDKAHITDTYQYILEKEDKTTETKYVENLTKFCSDFTTIGSYIITDSSRNLDFNSLIKDSKLDSNHAIFIVYDSTKSAIGYAGFSAYKLKADAKGDTFESLFEPVELKITLNALFENMMREHQYENIAMIKQKKEEALIDSLSVFAFISNQIKEKQYRILGNQNAEKEQKKNVIAPNIYEITKPLRTMNFLQKVLMY